MKKITSIAITILVLFQWPIIAEEKSEPSALEIRIGGRYSGLQPLSYNVRIHAVIAHHPDNNELIMTCSNIESGDSWMSIRDLIPEERNINTPELLPIKYSSPIYSLDPPFFYDMPHGEFECRAELYRNKKLFKTARLKGFA